MHVLVIGGAGFIGSHIAGRLRREGARIRILDSLDPRVHPAGTLGNVPPGVEFVRGDITDRMALEAALRDIDVVFHQAAYQDYMLDFSKFFRVNAMGTALLYEIIVERRLPIKKIIVASSQAVYGEGQYICNEHGLVFPPPRDQGQLSRREWEVKCPNCQREASPQLLDEQYPNPFNSYGVSKYAGERAALGLGWLHGIPTVILRYSITQGPSQSLYNHYSGICRIFVIRALANQPLILYEDGLQKRDFVHIDDVVDANLLVLEKTSADFKVYNVGSGVPTTVREYADAVKERIGRNLRFEFTAQYRLGDNRHSVSKIEKLELLGWKPKRNLGQILDDFIMWVKTPGSIPEDIPDAYAEMQAVGVVQGSSQHN